MATTTTNRKPRKPVLNVANIDWHAADDALSNHYGVDLEKVQGLRAMHGG